MFFDFQMPGAELDNYKKLSNVTQDGTFALGADPTQAAGTATKYLQDKFARDSSMNYQNNIRDAAGNIRNSLASAAGATSQNQSSTISALGNLYSAMPKSSGFLGSLLGMAGQLGTAAIPKI